MKVSSRVLNGWLAQSKKNQPQIRLRFVASMMPPWFAAVKPDCAAWRKIYLLRPGQSPPGNAAAIPAQPSDIGGQGRASSAAIQALI